MALIVVGVDHSEGAKAALRFALEEAKLRQATVRVVHAWQYGYIGATGLEGAYPPVGGDIKELRDAAETALEDTLRESIPETDTVEIERRVVQGRAAAALVDESRGADLLVVGSSHHTRFGRTLLGDVRRGVVRHAPCPVAVAPRAGDPGALGTVGVAFDGSPEADEALRLGDALAREPGRRLRIFVVAQLPEIARAYVYPDDWARHREALHRRAGQLLDRALSGLGAHAGGVVIDGDAARDLVAASREVDLMVVGSRCWGPARRVVAGSTSDHLLHHAACPVLVAPRTAKAAPLGAPRAAHDKAPA